MRLPRIDREKSLTPGQLDPILEGAIRSQPEVPGPAPRDPDRPPQVEEEVATVSTPPAAPLPQADPPELVTTAEQVRSGPPPAALAAVIGLVGFAGWMFTGGGRRG